MTLSLIFDSSSCCFYKEHWDYLFFKTFLLKPGNILRHGGCALERRLRISYRESVASSEPQNIFQIILDLFMVILL